MPPAVALRLTVPIEPMRRHRGRYTQFAPTLAETLDVRHLIILQRIEQTLEPAFPHDGGASTPAMTGTGASTARFTAAPGAPNELSTRSSAGESFSSKDTAPSAATTSSLRATCGFPRRLP